MSNLTMRHFDVLDFVDKSKELGVNENLAKYQARQIENAIDVAINNTKIEIDFKDLATKKDIESIRKEIETAKNQMILWVAGLFVASGFITHFFK